MSMLSAQIDGLRKAAQTYRDMGKHEAEQMMLDAADTIWQLRDDLQRVNAENAKLRNEVDNLRDFEHLTSVAVAYAGCDECGEYKQTMLRLFAENAKLRQELTLREASEQEKVIEYLRQENVDWEDMYRALKAENAKLREKAVAMLSELRGVVSEGDYDSPSGRYFLLRRDVAAYEDALRELGIEG